MSTGAPLEQVTDYPLVVGSETLKITALQMRQPELLHLCGRL
jgi:hypothetical protein